MSKWLNTFYQGQIGYILINRPEALNAMNHQMNLELLYFLEREEQNDSIKAYLIEGAGDKAFCAGGDIRALYNYLKSPYQEIKDLVHHFFSHEYRLNYEISRLKKPYVAILDGYVMGGGVGISVHGSHPIATDTTIFAMPENKIGLFPDVGALNLFQNCPHGIGLYLALTGERLNGHEMVYAKLAKAFISKSELENFKTDIFTGKDIDSLVEAYSSYDLSQIDFEKFKWIESHFSDPKSFEALITNLEKDKTSYSKGFWDNFSSLSLLSVYLTFNKFYAKESKTLKNCLENDFFYAINLTRVGDFIEGVRSKIIDKNDGPSFLFKKISELEKNFIDIHFNFRYDGITL